MLYLLQIKENIDEGEFFNNGSLKNFVFDGKITVIDTRSITSITRGRI